MSCDYGDNVPDIHDHPVFAIVPFDEALTTRLHCEDCRRDMRILHIDAFRKLLVFSNDSLLTRILSASSTSIEQVEPR